MLKNKDVIAELTDSQKVRLLTGVGCLSGKDFKILGIRGATACNMKDYGRDIFPHSTILSHSWNEKLWYRVAEAKADMLVKDGADIAVVPGAKIKLSPYRREITEDPYLASRFSASHASAADKAGLKATLSGYYLTESDVERMDSLPSERVISEFMTYPYVRGTEDGKATAVMTDIRPLREEYKSFGRRMQADIPTDKYLICESAGEENTVDFIARGIICLSASANALESAMTRYKKLKRDLEKGEGVTLDDIQAEERARTAISDETVDATLDRVIEFLKKSGNTPEPRDIDTESVAYRATLESTVLLKNVGFSLPLDKNKRIAIIGNVFPEDENGESGLSAVKEALGARGYSCVGVEPGYDVGDIQRSYLTEKALKLTDSASVVLLFLGFGYENEKNIQRTKSLELPANQLRLADMLVKRKKNVVCVLSAGHAPDIAFTRGFKAVLLAPLDVNASVPAIVSILSGEVSPSGKLAYTLYAGSDTAFRKSDIYKEHYGLKSGPFVGYRYYDTAGLTLGYPFGHGLSYSSFEYSDLVYDRGMVSFSVENIGTVEAAEVAEVYIGKKDSRVIRPLKELCGFVKMNLKPKEKKRVKIKVDIPKVYQSGKFSIENGYYTVYVGSSSADIRLTSVFNCTGDNLKRDGERLIDYIQSIPNVLEDNFTLEAKYCPMNKKPMKNILVGLIAIGLAIGLAIFNTSSGLSSVFLGIVAGILAVLAIIFFATDVLERNQSAENESAKMNEKNREYFSDAEEIGVFSTERMFSDEFDAKDDSESTDYHANDEMLDVEMSEYVDPEFKLADMVEDLAHFFTDRGMRLDNGVAENIAVSLASSKLLILDGIKSEDFNTFMLILSDYLATKTYVDKIDKETKEHYDCFHVYDNHGDFTKRSSVLALEDASKEKEKIHLLSVDGLDADTFDKLSAPFATYLTSTKDSSTVRVMNAQGANVGYSIRNNLKLVLRLDDAANVGDLPVSVLRAAAVTRVSFVKCQAASEWHAHHGCNRYQLDYIFEKESSAKDVSENVYKKIDKLESFVASHADYKIGNKLWLAFEKQIGLLLSAKKELNDAIDAAVATKLLPSMISALNGNLTKEDESLKETLEFIFGEENIELSASIVASVENMKTQAARAEAKRENTAENMANENAKHTTESTPYAAAAADEAIAAEGATENPETLSNDGNTVVDSE